MSVRLVRLRLRFRQAYVPIPSKKRVRDTMIVEQADNSTHRSPLQ
jgi:hypothetical protein